MRLRILAPAFLLLVPLFAGCFQIHTTIFLNEDGSGTIEETIQLASFAVNMMASMDTTEAFSLIDEDKLNSRADSLGEGVVFEGVEAVSDGSFEGYIAVYSFSDISKVRLNDSSDALQLNDDDEPSSEDPSEGMNGLGLDGVTFSYEPGVLHIHIPHDEGSGEDMHPDTLAAKTEEMRQQMEETGGMMRAFLADARFAVTIEFPSAISETNAAYAEDTKVTLADITFGPLIDLMQDNPELAVRLQEAQTEAQRQAILVEIGDMEDFRYEPGNEIVVCFD